MPDLQQRLRRAFSSMAATESLADIADENSAAQLLKWGETITEQLVYQTSHMEDDTTSDEYLSTYLNALRKMMRAIGRWVMETDLEKSLEWWKRIEQNGKTLYGENFLLPAAQDDAPSPPPAADAQQKLNFVINLIEKQKSKG